MTQKALVARNVLVLGGTSSLAKPVIARLEENGSKIYTTSRRDPARLLPLGSELFLDVFSDESVRAFDGSLTGSYDVVISFIGAPYRAGSSELEYVSAYLTRLTTVFRFAMARLTADGPGLFVNVSSRAAVHPSRDTFYAATKAGLVAAVRSLARELPENHKAVSLLPGLVLGSKMSQDMPQEIVLEHQRRSGGKLLSPDSFSDEVQDLLRNFDSLKNGEALLTGVDYE